VTTWKRGDWRADLVVLNALPSDMAPSRVARQPRPPSRGLFPVPSEWLVSVAAAGRNLGNERPIAAALSVLDGWQVCSDSRRPGLARR